MNDFRYLGFLSSAPPERSVLLACAGCKVTWTGCADAADCPECGSADDYEAWYRSREVPA